MITRLNNGGPGSGCKGSNCGRPRRDFTSETPKVGDKHVIERKLGIFGDSKEEWDVKGVAGSDETGYQLDLSKGGLSRKKMVHSETAVQNLVTDYMKVNPGKNRAAVEDFIAKMRGEDRVKLWSSLGKQHEKNVAEKYKSEVKKATVSPSSIESARAELVKLEAGLDKHYQYSDDPSVFQAESQKADRIKQLKGYLRYLKVSNGGPGSGPRAFKGQIGHHVVAMRLEKKGHDLISNGDDDAGLLHLRRACDYYRKSGATGKAQVLENKIKHHILRKHGYENRLREMRALGLNTWVFVPISDKLSNHAKVSKDRWYQIVPKGEFPHPKGVVQVIDDEAIDSMMENFNRQKVEDINNGGFAGLLLDLDHLSQSPDSKSEAAGWIMNLQKRPDGIYAQIDLTDIGETAIGNGRYKFFSPVWNRRDCKELGDKRVKPLVIDSAALTNEPNMKMRPIV